MKKQNRYGYTLVEVIGVIVILAIILAIATISYKSITEGIRKQAYKNKITYLEENAALYAYNTGYLSTNVMQLVEEGYITADNEKGEVISPLDNEIMNCHILVMSQEQDIFYGTYTDSIECDSSKIERINLNIDIEIYEAANNTTLGKQIEKNIWTKEDVFLVAKLKKENIDKSKIKEIIWSSNFGDEAVKVDGNFDESNRYLVSAAQLIDTSYQVTVIMYDGTQYKASTRVKIDKQRPIIYKDETKIEKEEEYINHSREIEIMANDQNGSGIYGYSISLTNDCSKAIYDENHELYYKTALDEGTYYICVRDNVGNISEDISTYEIVIDKIDQTPPKCLWNGENNNWTTDEVTITLSGEDDESGSNSFYTKSYTDGEVKSEDLTYYISDNAGNESVCQKDVDVYFDRQGPTVPTVGKLGNINNSNANGEIEIKASGSTDNGVGGIVYKYIVSLENETPNKNDERFKESPIFPKVCGKMYYAWAIAEDALGNRSDVRFLGFSNSQSCCPYSPGQIVRSFDYTGGIQYYTVECSGTYKLEVYGAQGGHYFENQGKCKEHHDHYRSGCTSKSAYGGAGGYAFGNAVLEKGSTLFIGVGDYGRYTDHVNHNYTGTGYNGGGSPCGTGYAPGAGGGGATHIALNVNRGILSNYVNNKNEVLIVAGGGGGGAARNATYTNYGNGGAGGGLSGSRAYQVNTRGDGWDNAYGGTQYSGGYHADSPDSTVGTFGKGGNSGCQYGVGGGGGAGWYGGGGAKGAYDGGAGGSGYIGGVSGGSMQNGVRWGSGFARITLISLD